MKKVNEVLDSLPAIPRQVLVLAVVFGTRGKLDGDETVEKLRVLFAVVQTMVTLTVFYLQYVAIPNDPHAYVPVVVASLRSDRTHSFLSLSDDQISVLPSEIRSSFANASATDDEKDKHGNVKKIKITKKEYDLSKIAALRTKVFMGATIGFGIHMYFGVPMPLLMQSIMQPMSLYDDQLFKIHLLRRDPLDYPDLKRPWKDGSAAGGGGWFKDKLAEYQKQLDDMDASEETNADESKKSK